MRRTKCEDFAPARGTETPALFLGLLLGLLLTATLGLTACAPPPLSAPSLATTTSPTSPTTSPSSTGPSVPADATPEPSVTTLPGSGSTTRTPGRAPTSSPPVPASPAVPAGNVVDATGHVETAFATAAGGIVCAVSADGPQARCDLESSTWKPPPTPADCHGAWGAGISLTSAGAQLTCTSDTVLADATPGGAGTWWAGLPTAKRVSRSDGRQEVTLAPGAVVVAGTGASRLTCRSDTATVTCTLGPARFTLSKQAYSLR